MKINEIFNKSSIVQEIERLPAGEYTGGKNELYHHGAEPRQNSLKKLPGGSGFLYSIQDHGFEIAIKLWTLKTGGSSLSKPRGKPYEFEYEYQARLNKWEKSKKSPYMVVGKLVLEPYKSFPLNGAVTVDTITVHEDYRGMGLAKALYGIVLSIMKRPLIAGDYQTPGGRKNWVSISKIPGVDVNGYLGIADIDMDEDAINILMGKLGVQYIGKGKYGKHYFSFDVLPNESETELKAHVNTILNKVYRTMYHRLTIGNNTDVGLYAVWTGK